MFGRSLPLARFAWLTPKRARHSQSSSGPLLARYLLLVSTMILPLDCLAQYEIQGSESFVSLYAGISFGEDVFKRFDGNSSDDLVIYTHGHLAESHAKVSQSPNGLFGSLDEIFGFGTLRVRGLSAGHADFQALADTTVFMTVVDAATGSGIPLRGIVGSSAAGAATSDFEWGSGGQRFSLAAFGGDISNSNPSANFVLSYVFAPQGQPLPGLRSNQPLLAGNPGPGDPDYIRPGGDPPLPPDDSGSPPASVSGTFDFPPKAIYSTPIAANYGRGPNPLFFKTGGSPPVGAVGVAPTNASGSTSGGELPVASMRAASAGPFLYTVSDNQLTELLIPDALPGGDNEFEIRFGPTGEFTRSISAGVPFNFLSFAPNGVSWFVLSGLDLDNIADPLAGPPLVTGLSFLHDGVQTLRIYAAVPEPSTWALACLPLAYMGCVIARRRRDATRGEGV